MKEICEGIDDTQNFLGHKAGEEWTDPLVSPVVLISYLILCFVIGDLRTNVVQTM
jgi:hypothetical protein